MQPKKKWPYLIESWQIVECKCWDDAFTWVKDGKYNHRPLRGNNTIAKIMTDNNVQVTYKDIPVVTYLPDGRFVISSGNVHTKVVMRKINDHIPRPYVVQKKHRQQAWELVNQETGAKYDFFDDMLIIPGAPVEIHPATATAVLGLDRDWVTDSNDYLNEYMRILMEGEMGDQPRNIDLTPPLDEITSKVQALPAETVRQLIINQAYPPSLLIRAMDYDASGAVYRKVMDEMITLAPEHWRTHETVREKARGVFRRILRRLIKVSLGVPV